MINGGQGRNSHEILIAAVVVVACLVGAAIAIGWAVMG